MLGAVLATTGGAVEVDAAACDWACAVPLDCCVVLLLGGRELLAVALVRIGLRRLSLADVDAFESFYVCPWHIGRQRLPLSNARAARSVHYWVHQRKDLDSIGMGSVGTTCWISCRSL